MFFSWKETAEVQLPGQPGWQLPNLLCKLSDAARGHRRWWN
jgi:hypothetical protein